MDVKSLFSVEGRVALVTGGSAGIGRHIAAALAAAGARVYICARSAERVGRAAEEIQGEVVGLPADLSTMAGLEAVAAEIGRREPALHILVNNAGTMADAPI